MMEMNIKVTKTSDNKIDVRDSANIRLMLLTEKENKGLYTYFEVKMAQAKEAKKRTEQSHFVNNNEVSVCRCDKWPTEAEYNNNKCEDCGGTVQPTN